MIFPNVDGFVIIPLVAIHSFVSMFYVYRSKFRLVDRLGGRLGAGPAHPDSNVCAQGPGFDLYSVHIRRNPASHRVPSEHSHIQHRVVTRLRTRETEEASLVMDELRACGSESCRVPPNTLFRFLYAYMSALVLGEGFIFFLNYG